MLERGTSWLGGAAIAALLTLPATAANGDWVAWPAKSYNAGTLRLENIVGNITVDVREGGPISVRVGGTRQRLHGVSVRNDGGKVVVDAEESGSHGSVWNWHDWFNFSADYETQPDTLSVHVTVPRGARVEVHDLVGDATIGDTEGALNFEAVSTKAKIGQVGPARVSMDGDGRVDIARVNGPLHLEVGGSGRITVGPTQSVNASIAGSGDAQFGAIAGGLTVDIAGSGDVSATRVNGPTHVDIAGSGDVRIADGTADPLHLDIMGAGNFTFGGVAVDPHIDAFGSGKVRLKSYRGHLDTEGMADVKIGMGDKGSADVNIGQ